MRVRRDKQRQMLFVIADEEREIQGDATTIKYVLGKQ